MQLPVVDSIFRGHPKVLSDERGEWVSSIQRDAVSGPIRVLQDGLEGDRVAQPYHGGPDAAICVHLCDHYRFWKQRFGLNLEYGRFGENLLLDGIAEENVCVGDVVRIGDAQVQVSAPRMPCANQARHVGRTDWVKVTVAENRTGFYLRVLKPGTVRPGDFWHVEQRWNEAGSISAINRGFYGDLDREFAARVQEMEGLAEWWKQQFREKLREEQEHGSLRTRE